MACFISTLATPAGSPVCVSVSVPVPVSVCVSIFSLFMLGSVVYYFGSWNYNILAGCGWLAMRRTQESWCRPDTYETDNT
jgi:hypothetical protein